MTSRWLVAKNLASPPHVNFRVGRRVCSKSILNPVLNQRKRILDKSIAIYACSVSEDFLLQEDCVLCLAHVEKKTLQAATKSNSLDSRWKILLACIEGTHYHLVKGEQVR